MFRTIFSKLIVIFLLILGIAFTITGFMLNFFLNDYMTDEKADTLEVVIGSVNRAFGRYLEYIDPNDSVNVVLSNMFLQESLATYGNLTKSIIWITDENGYLFQSNWDMPATIKEKYTDDTGLVRLLNDKQLSKLTLSETTVREVGDFEGFFKDPYFADKGGDTWLSVGRSFEYIGASSKRSMVIIFMHTPVAEVKAARTQFFRYFLISGGVAIFIAVLLTYIFSLRISRPLKQIKNAATRISGGEFGKRLDIKSRDEIGELAKAFNQMAVALQNIEEMRRGFIANVSHELRTPMTSIRGFIEGILDGTIPPEKHSQYLSIVRDETNRLNRLVNDLLDLARMEAGEMKLNITTLDINELIRKCVIKMETLLLDKELTVDADFEDENMPVKADADAIERVVYNLLHNAIKFTPEGGKISIITRKAKDKVEVTIRDTGIGIEANELEMIWERFYKSDKSRGKDKTGTGLGLAIVRNIIIEHGQTIRVESKPGEGTAFTFTLARAQKDAEE